MMRNVHASLALRACLALLVVSVALFAVWGLGPARAADPVTGLDFPGSNGGSSTIRFRFANPQNNGLPIYGPGGAGVTYIWRAYPRQQAGYYTAFFWGNDGNFIWRNGNADTYYGAHPYPRNGPSSSTHDWEIAIEQGDFVNGAVVYNRWYTQALRVWSDANGKHHEFYWDLPNTDAAHRVTVNSPTSWGNVNPPSPALTWGDAPWNPGNEIWDGVLRGIQIYNSLLALNDIQSEAAVPLSTSAGMGSIWYLNSNPTPTDISDKSGQGHNPEWVGSGRPTLYTAQSGAIALSASTYSVNENAGTLMITALRVGSSSGAVSVNYATSNGTATAGSDYTATSGTLSWADGDTTPKTFTVSILSDTVAEPNETFTVSLSAPTGGVELGAPSIATVTILDNGSPGTVSLSAGAYSVNETAGSVTVTAVRTGGSLGTVGVTFATLNGTATAGADYTATTGTLSWADGDTTAKTFTIGILPDTLVEGNETFTVRLSSPSGGATLGGVSSATVTIVDAPAPGTIALTTSALSVQENAGTVSITATRTGGSSGAVSVSYATSNGTATAGSDYVAASGTLSWASGDTASKTITVTVLSDTLVEGDETFGVALSSPTGGATLGSPSAATVTIVDVITPGTIALTASSFTVQENAGTVSITATRTGGSSGAVGVSYATSNGTATAGSDYTAAAGTILWASGDTAPKTFTVTVNDDAAMEGNETFTVTLSNPTGGAALGSPSSATVTIVDNDGAGTMPTTGLSLWLKGDAGVTLAGSGVSQWSDQSGSGRHATQTSFTSRPTVAAGALNGLPALAFDGVNDYLTFFMPVNGLTGMTIVVVAANSADRTGGSTNAENAAVFWNEINPWGSVHLSPFQNNVKFRFGTGQTGNLPVYSRPASIGSSFSISTAIKNRSTDSLYVNGSLVVSQSGKLMTIANTGSLGNIGRGYDNNTFFPGLIAEVLVYNRALSDAERQSAESYLNAKYFTGAPPPNQPPTIATPAAANPNPTTGATTNLSVLGADGAGESTLSYTWAVTAKPAGAADPTYSVNGTNTAKNTVTTVSQAGAYTFQVTVRDAQNLTTSSSTTATVSPALTAIAVTPDTATVAPGATAQFNALATDQFGAPLTPQPAFTWTATGGGTLDTSGLFTADPSGGGPFTISASSGSVSGTASVTVSSPAAVPTAGLRLWLKADAGITVAGTSVSQWADQSGNNRNATQATSSSRPTLVASALNGKPAVAFNGINQFMTFSMPVNGLSGMTMILVGANTSDRNGGNTNAANAALFWNETGPWGTVYLSPFQTNVKFRFGTGQTNNLPSFPRPSSIGSGYSMSIATKNGATESLHVDGVLELLDQGNVATIGFCQSTGNLGRGYNNNTYFPGRIAEVLVYDRALGDAERESVEAYLNAKYFPGQ
jgi:hypothetical protein